MPHAFASRSLSIVFGVKRFHHYLLGQYNQIISLNLQHLFGKLKAVPLMASARIQQWALTLAAYHYDISGKENANADVLEEQVTIT